MPVSHTSDLGTGTDGADIGRRRRRRGSTLLAAAVAVSVAGATVACSRGEEQVHSIGYAIDNAVTTYNANTADGSASGAPQAFARVLTGLNYLGPDGGPIADTDVGTASIVPGDVLTVQYRLDPKSVYSDGVPMSCDDLVLAWAAGSGRFTGPNAAGKAVNLFNSANRAGYADIDRVDCQPGSKEATVVFQRGHGFTDWHSLFGATALMPAHVVARASGVPDVVGVIRSGDTAALARIAEFWNTGWTLTPGQLDLSLLPSSGPYRIESYTAEDGLVLAANERWWGNKPATSRIVVWPKGSDVKSKIDENGVEVVDIGAGSVPGLEFGDRFTVANAPSRSVEQLVLATTGVFESASARRALALCTPRQQLFDEVGHQGFDRTTRLGSGVLDSRITAPDNPIYPAVAATVGGRYHTPDTAGASAARAESGQSKITVRIGYLGPDPRRARTVAAIASSCAPAGITVEDAGSAQFTPSLLGAGHVDAVLAGTAAAAGAAGSRSGTAALDAVHSGSGSNFGKYANSKVDGIVDQLVIDGALDAQQGLSVQAETILWNELPSIPLFNEPRTTAFASGMRANVANPTTSGAGWNMDRWILLG